MVERLTESFRKALDENASAIAQSLDQIKTTGLKFVQRIPQGDHTVYLYRSEGQNLVFVVSREADGRIDSLSSFPIPAPVSVVNEK
jgi:hypothetical protein